MPNRWTRLMVSLALFCAGCGGSAAAPPDAGGESLIVKGDQMCEQLFRDHETYLSKPGATVDGLLAIGSRMLVAFKKLDPPREDERWSPALNTLWSTVSAAKGAGEQLVAPLWEFAGAARVKGLWLCGAEQARALAGAKRPAGSEIATADFASRLQKVIDSTAAAHEAYHEDPDPEEVKKRILPGDADSHGPGYLAIEDAIIDGVAALPPPRAAHAEAAAFLSLLRQARAEEAHGIAIGGPAGDAAYELGFFSLSQAIGIACVEWSLDLCG